MNAPRGRRARRRLWQKKWPDHPELTADVEFTVPFHDADPTGVAWHGNYFRYYDAARSALLAKLRFGYRQMATGQQLWPIVDTRVRYRRSIAYGMTATVSAQLVEWDYRIVIYYEIVDADNRSANEAYTVQVPVSIPHDTLIVGTPKALRTRIRDILGG